MCENTVVLARCDLEKKVTGQFVFEKLWKHKNRLIETLSFTHHGSLPD